MARSSSQPKILVPRVECQNSEGIVLKDLNTCLLENSLLTRTLKVEPLKNQVLIRYASDEEPVLFVVLVDEVLCNGIRLRKRDSWEKES